LRNLNKKAITLYVASYFLPIIFALVVNARKLDIYEPRVIGGLIIVLIVGAVGLWKANDILYKQY